MIRVGLTGNIGSGKSTVSKIFNVFGVPVFYSDVEARLLYFDDEVKRSLVLLFGKKILTNKDDVDTKMLASIIFSDKNALKTLTELIHPLVFNKYESWCNTFGDKPITIHESAIIFENNLQNYFDYVINVTAPIDIRISRVMLRDSVSREMVLERIANQMEDSAKVKLSDFNIVNDGKQFLIPQVEKIYNKINELIN